MKKLKGRIKQPWIKVIYISLNIYISNYLFCIPWNIQTYVIGMILHDKNIVENSLSSQWA